jgi:hypothetical protein
VCPQFRRIDQLTLLSTRKPFCLQMDDHKGRSIPKDSLDVICHFEQHLSSIGEISFIGGGNCRSATTNWLTWSNKVVAPWYRGYFISSLFKNNNNNLWSYYVMMLSLWSSICRQNGFRVLSKVSWSILLNCGHTDQCAKKGLRKLEYPEKTTDVT